jgi:hypothetical protein
MDKKEVFRDVLALGSIIFYFIVLVRALIGDYLPFVYQLVIAFVLLIVLSYFVKGSNNHLARMLVLVIFTSLFYNQIVFTVFVSFVFVLAIVSSYYLKKDILKGLVLGIVSSLVSYFLVQTL